MIEVKGLTKIYGGTTVLDIPELIIEKGDSFGLVGNNGAGKTTFFRLILDLIRANSGIVKSKGEDVKLSGTWKYYTGSYLDQRFVIDFLTPEEYFEFLNEIYGLSKGDLDQFYYEFKDIFNDEILGKKRHGCGMGVSGVILIKIRQPRARGCSHERFLSAHKLWPRRSLPSRRIPRRRGDSELTCHGVLPGVPAIITGWERSALTAYG